MTRTCIAIVLIAVVTLSAHAWTQLLLKSPAVMTFVTSDAFWPTVIGVVGAFACVAGAVCTALVYHPDALSGRRPEGGE